MFDKARFIADCRAALTESQPELAVKSLVEAAVARPGEVEQDLGTPEEAGLVSLYEGPELTILNVVWAPGMSIYPHDHRMWAVIGLYGGREDNLFYRKVDGRLTKAGGKQLETSETVVLADAVIHAVTNPLHRLTGAIHVYGGEFFRAPRSEWDADGLTERPYDVARARQVFADANRAWRRERSQATSA